MILAYFYRKFKDSKKEFRAGVIGVVVIIIIIRLLIQFGTGAMTPNTGFQASVLGAGEFTMPPLPTNSASVGMASEPSISGLDSGNITNGFNFLVGLRVVNAGEPSVAWNWKAYIILPDTKEKIPAQLPGIAYYSIQGATNEMSMNSAFGPIIHIGKEGNIMDQLLTSELPRGKAVIGWLMVHVNGIDKLPWGTTFVISFDNAFGHETPRLHICGIRH